VEQKKREWVEERRRERTERNMKIWEEKKRSYKGRKKKRCVCLF
jgi:hypothetical protein